jgi:hypothetical protein
VLYPPVNRLAASFVATFFPLNPGLPAELCSFDRIELRKTAAIKTSTTSRPTLPLAQPVSDNDAIDMATLELLASWRLQDATTDPEQIRAAEQELAEFKKALNESRAVAGEPVLFP